MTSTPGTINLKVDAATIAAAFQKAADALRQVQEASRAAAVACADVADPPSRERRELRLIARAERAEALLEWERFKAAGCRP